LRDDVAALGRNLQVEYVELRNAYNEQCVGFEPLLRYVTFTQAIGSDQETILQTIPRKTRYMVRKALKEQYTCTQRSSATSAFVDLYLRNLHRLGTPAFPRKLFDQLIHHFGNTVDVREYSLNGHVAAAVLTFYFRDRVMPYYGASDPAMNNHSPNNYMYFDLMRWGGQNGYATFDFGRSKKGVGGSYDFKAHWGMVERLLPYEVYLVKAKSLPNHNPANPKFSLPIKIWQTLPLWMTKLIGPSLVRFFP
jgi:FemAB-related protein (PEP-CTERM system-associated)